MTPTDVDWFLDGERARGASPATLRSYGADLRTYAAWLEGRAQTPATATRADVRAYASDLAGRGLAPASRARALAALRSLHRRLLTAGRATADPAAELPGPKRERRLPDAPRESELGRLLDDPWPDGEAGLRDRATLELLYGCGLRVSEVCGLDRGDVDARSVRVLGKGDKERWCRSASRPPMPWPPGWPTGAPRWRPVRAATRCCSACAAGASRRPRCGASSTAG